jgi:rSAM/selenodomain-associated transferase 1
MNPTIALMLKAPVAGQVKTRLAAGVGAAAACQAYRRLVEHQMGRIPAGWTVRVFFDPPDAGPSMRQWLGPNFVYTPQVQGDLGDRMLAVLSQHAFATGPLVFVGGDCPYLDVKISEVVARELAQVDVVVIPALDGGYVLIGMRAPHPGLFRDIDWSTERVLEQTLTRARDLGLSVTCLEALEDVDDEASWLRALRILR